MGRLVGNGLDAVLAKLQTAGLPGLGPSTTRAIEAPWLVGPEQAFHILQAVMSQVPGTGEQRTHAALRPSGFVRSALP